MKDLANEWGWVGGRILFFLVLCYFFAQCACATMNRAEGCSQVADSRLPTGWKAYSCPHPFMAMGLTDDGYAPGGNGTGYGAGAKWVRGLTDFDSKTIWVWDRFPESFEHELWHATTGRTH